MFRSFLNLIAQSDVEFTCIRLIKNVSKAGPLKVFDEILDALSLKLHIQFCCWY